MPSVGVDSCVFSRLMEGSSFTALLGIAVTTLDRDKFRQSYDKILNDVFKEIGEKRKKNTYKAAQLTSQLQNNTSKFLDLFIDKISSELIRVNVFFTFYPEDKIDRIYTCKDSYLRAYSPSKFMDLITNAYPHYCVWRYLEAHPDCSNYLFEVDNFEGKITPAWEKIKDIKNLHIYYSGNETNKLISAADLLLRYICNKLIGDLNGKSILYCLKDLLNETKIHSYYLGYRSDYLRSMAFTDDLMINTRNYVKHPVYWILWKSFSGQGEEKNILEWSKEYNEVMNLAEINNGCVRFYKASEIPHLLNEENDVLCLLNDGAAPYIDSIKTIAPKVKLLDLRGRS
jgi:hypothetical protein